MGENVRTGRLAKGLGPVASRVSNEQGPHHEHVDDGDKDEDEIEVQDGIQDIFGLYWDVYNLIFACSHTTFGKLVNLLKQNDFGN